MPVTTRVEPIDKDIDLIFREDLSPQARSATLAEFARETLADVEATDAEVIGHVPAHVTFVDGREGAAEESVRPDGAIVYEFDLIDDVLAWIGYQLVTHSPVLTGRYANSHVLFADGIQIAAGQELATPVPPGSPLPLASRYVFVSEVPYARKIERGESPQSPDGVYQSVAALASRRFGNVARISFSYEAPLGTNSELETWAKSTRQTRGTNRAKADAWNRRQPAIIVELR